MTETREPAPSGRLLVVSRDASFVTARAAGDGWVVQAGLWGVVAAVTTLAFWPPPGRAAIGEAVRGQVRALLGAPAVFADTPALGDPPAQPAHR